MVIHLCKIDDFVEMARGKKRRGVLSMILTKEGIYIPVFTRRLKIRAYINTPLLLQFHHRFDCNCVTGGIIEDPCYDYA